MLDQVGFGPRMKRWLMWCITTASISVIINGSPSEPFKMQKGIRQGDLISSFIFSIVGEALNYIILEAKTKGLIKGLEIGKDNIELTHLQFADDTIIFLPGDSEVVLNYRRLLSCFSLMAGLTINFQNSNLIRWGRGELWIQDMSSMMQCQWKQLPITYIGIPLGANFSRKHTWELVLEKIRGRLATWKARLLSRSGRLQLIKTVLNSLSIYYLSMF